MRRVVLIGAAAVIAALSLASCESREERNAARCTSYGADQNGYSDCMSRLAAADAQSDAGFWHYMAVSHMFSHYYAPHVVVSTPLFFGPSHPTTVVHTAPRTTIINTNNYHAPATPPTPPTPNRWTFRRPTPSSSSRPSFTPSFARRSFGRRR